MELNSDSKGEVENRGQAYSSEFDGNEEIVRVRMHDRRYIPEARVDENHNGNFRSRIGITNFDGHLHIEEDYHD